MVNHIVFILLSTRLFLWRVVITHYKIIGQRSTEVPSTIVLASFSEWWLPSVPTVLSSLLEFRYSVPSITNEKWLNCLWNNSEKTQIGTFTPSLLFVVVNAFNNVLSYCRQHFKYPCRLDLIFSWKCDLMGLVNYNQGRSVEKERHSSFHSVM